MITILIGLLVFFVITLCPCYISYLIVRRFHPHLTNSARWTATAILSIGLIIFIFLCTAHLHLFFRSLVTVVCFTFTIVAHLVWKRHGNLTAEFEALNDWLKWATRPKAWPLLIIGVVVILFTFCRASFMPPLAWDSLTYHLVFAGEWVQEHALVTFSAPDGIDSSSHFPINGEIISAWVMLPFHSDFLANLINFPFLLLAACGLYALGRELKLDRGFSIILSCLVCFSPMVFAYTTTGYVDTMVLAEIICAALFFFRFLRTRKTMDALFMFLSLGIAIGTKQTSFYIAALMSFLLLLIILQEPRQKKASLLFSVIPLGLALLILTGGYQYIKNWVEAKNPFYPIEISFAGHTIFPGSLFPKKVADEIGLGKQSDELKNVKILFNYLPEDYPRTAGPKFFVFAIVALFSVFFPPKWSKRKKFWFLMLLWFIPLILFYMDNSTNSILIRRFSPYSTPRFIAAPLALMTLVAVLQFARLQKHLPSIKFILSIFIIWDLLQVNFNLLHPVQNGFFIVFFGAGLILPIWILIKWYHKRVRWPCLVVSGIMLFTLTVGTVALQKYRAKNRRDYYSNYTDLHDIPRQFVDGWHWCDNPNQPLTIALTTGWKNPGHHWFFYPLMGRTLQNRIVYASINRKGISPTHIDQGLLREKGDFNIWIENLNAQDVDLIFIQEPWPLELQWILSTPQYFKLEFKGDSFYIYRFLPETR